MLRPETVTNGHPDTGCLMVDVAHTGLALHQAGDHVTVLGQEETQV